MRDVIIVGGGPAGLSAALVLGRCRRDVLLIDSDRPRNRASRAMHNYLTRDGVPPAEFRREAFRELKKLQISMIRGLVTNAACMKSGFTLRLESGRAIQGRKLLVATGVVDQLPQLSGLAELYGVSVHHCPFCDAHQWRDRPLAAYGRGRKGAGLALALRNWSDDVIVLSDGRSGLRQAEREKLEQHGISLREDRIARLVGTRGRLRKIEFASGPPLRRDALFFNTGQYQRSGLPWMLGCAKTPVGGVKVDRHGRTGIPGLFVAGDALREVQFVITAAADGAAAAVAIHSELQHERGLTL